jgi:hypothetical protein
MESGCDMRVFHENISLEEEVNERDERLAELFDA